MNALEEVDIILRIQENPFLTAVDFAREFGVARGTINSLFLRHGIKCRTAATTLRLTEEHRINRLAFCQILLQQWQEDDLESIIFTDEKTFCTDVSWRTKVYRPDNTRYHFEYMKVEDQSGHVSQNYWGAIGIEGPLTPLVPIIGRFNSARYRQILQRHIVPLMHTFQANDLPRIFMQDNCPAHTSDAIMQYLDRQNIPVMAWPPKSPDLNPIENVWAEITRNWPNMHQRNAQALDVEVQQRWQDLSQNGGRCFEDYN